MTHRCCFQAEKRWRSSISFGLVVKGVPLWSWWCSMFWRHWKQNIRGFIRAYFWHDNAACYHCANTILACQIIEQSTGIKVEQLDFSNSQGGKGVADRMATTCKTHIRIYLNEGHHVTTAEQMRCAILSHRGVKGVRVAVPPSLNATAKLQKIPGISKINNFQYINRSPPSMVCPWYRSRKEHCGGQVFRSVPFY